MPPFTSVTLRDKAGQEVKLSFTSFHEIEIVIGKTAATLTYEQLTKGIESLSRPSTRTRTRKKRKQKAVTK